MEIKSAVPASAFEQGLLNEEHHERLLANLPEFCRVANIQPKYVWSKLSDYLTAEDLTWVRSVRVVDTVGLAYVGRDKNTPVEDKMSAIAGCFLRNYVDARVMTLQAVLAALDSGDMPNPSVLLIPNFFLTANNGGKVATWEVSALLGFLYGRMTANQKTIIYIGDYEAMGKEYGTAFIDHIQAHYALVNL